MKILPVLDLLNGVVVRGVAGRRETYRPIQSRLAVGSDPRTIARAFRDRLGLRELYLADLDAIQQGRPNFDLYHALAEDGFCFHLDAGLRSLDDARQLLAAGATTVIAGLETSGGPDQLRQLCDELGSQRVVFSLDLKEGEPFGWTAPWNSQDPYEIGRQAIGAGIERLIVLDLAQVGVGNGLSTMELCRRLRSCLPELEIMTGGGVRGSEDIAALAALGVDGVLVASALHDGRLGSDEITHFHSLERVSNTRG